MRVVARCAGVLLLAGCQDSTATSFSYPPPCSGEVSLKVVSLSGSPAFTWTPNCGMTDLTVTREPAPVGGEDPVWAFEVPMNAPFGPVVAYGAAPQRARVLAGPGSIAIGVPYRVTVEYVVGGDAVSARGSATFTWYGSD